MISANVEYSLLTSRTEVGLYLYIPGYTEGDSRFGQCGFLLLDEALGEYDVEMKLGLIKMFGEAEPQGSVIHWSNSLRHFDDVYERLTAGA